nr:Chain C, NP [Ebola virus]5VAP_D Chain D, NP [Ebola virus]
TPTVAPPAPVYR